MEWRQGQTDSWRMHDGVAPQKHSPQRLQGARAEESWPDSTGGCNSCLRTQTKWKWSRRWCTELAEDGPSRWGGNKKRVRQGLQGRGVVVSRGHTHCQGLETLPVPAPGLVISSGSLVSSGHKIPLCKGRRGPLGFIRSQCPT
jgi:hypothetical protein